MPKLHNQIISQIMASPRGILASDERIESINKKFAKLGIPETPEMRRKFRELILTAPQLRKHINAVILSSETIMQTTSDGRNFTDELHSYGILSGMKIDGGPVHFTGNQDQKFTEGLDGLGNRLDLAAKNGASFTKWRMISTLNEPDYVLNFNSRCLAYQAKQALAENLIPINEPELLNTGIVNWNDAEQANQRMIDSVIRSFKEFKVPLKDIIIKTNFVTIDANLTIDDIETITEHTKTLLVKMIPHDIGGVVFLSGGLPSSIAIGVINKLRENEFPFPTTFSFLRAFEQEPLEIWRGHDSNIGEAQNRFIELLSKATK